MRKLDPQLKLLFIGVMVLLGLLFADEKFFQSDGTDVSGCKQPAVRVWWCLSGSDTCVQLGVSDPPPGASRITEQRTVQTVLETPTATGTVPPDHLPG